MRPRLSTIDEPFAPAAAGTAAAVPALDDFDYQAQRFIETDSKMSVVLLATTGKQRRPVVLKIARVDQRARAEANRQAIQNTVLWLRRLGRHHGLVRLYPVAVKSQTERRARSQAPEYCATLRQWAGQPEFLVMEYLAGGSFRDIIGAQPLTIDAALWIAYHLAQSLAYIHHQGCVHRDIKPENILFRSLPADGSTNGNKLGQLRPVLVDFGVAAARGEPKLVSGSRLWMAPELQAAYEQSPLPVDPAWDVYALGLILCYMITGRRPRRRSYEYASVLAYRDHTLAVLEQELKKREKRSADETQEPPRTGQQKHGEFNTINVRLQQLITAMLDREPAKRPAAQAIVAATTTLLADLGTPLPVDARLRMQLERSRHLPQRKRLQLVLVAALVVGVLLGGLAGLLITWPSPADARDAGVQAAQSGENGAAVTPGQGDATSTPQVQTVVVQRQITPTGALSSEPTRVPLTLAASQPPPTLITLQTPATGPPPTLIPFTPVPLDTAVATQPVVIPPTRRQTVVISSPAAPAQRRNTPRQSPTPRPSATAQATPAPAVEQVQLLAPESGTRSAQGKVEFAWHTGAQPPANDHCFELVFWNPDKPADKRSPVGAGKATRRRVDFTLLFNSSDPLLRALTQSDRDFNWGVRIVSCAAPRTVLQDVQQARTYSYKGQ